MIQLPLITYQKPTIQLYLDNPTTDTHTVYLGGQNAYGTNIAEYGQILSNPNFDSGGTGWTAVGWVFGGGTATYILPVVPTSVFLEQIIAVTPRTYKARAVFSFSAPYTGNVVIANGTNTITQNYVAATGAQVLEGLIDYTPLNIAIRLTFNPILPTAIGTQITVDSIELLDINDPNVQYYQFVNTNLASNPARMYNTRLIYSNPANLGSVNYELSDFTGRQGRNIINLLTYRNPTNGTDFQGVIDIKNNVSYILDGNNALVFALPPLSSLVYLADVVYQVGI